MELYWNSNHLPKRPGRILRALWHAVYLAQVNAAKTPNQIDTMLKAYNVTFSHLIVPQTKLILCSKPTMVPFLRISSLIVQCLDHFIPDSSKHLVQMRPFMSDYYLALEALAFRKTMLACSRSAPTLLRPSQGPSLCLQSPLQTASPPAHHHHGCLLRPASGVQRLATAAC